MCVGNCCGSREAVACLWFLHMCSKCRPSKKRLLSSRYSTGMWLEDAEGQMSCVADASGNRCGMNRSSKTKPLVVAGGRVYSMSLNTGQRLTTVSLCSVDFLRARSFVFHPQLRHYWITTRVSLLGAIIWWMFTYWYAVGHSSESNIRSRERPDAHGLT